MAYSLSFSKRAFKELEQIGEPFYSNIKQAIYGLTENPRPQGVKKLKGRDGYRIRVGNYRVIYNIFDKQLVVDVITIGNRKDVYE
ncbi:MAG: addiction module toxin, RelE/StbE family [Bacteroidetes bacterium]|nr:addiction module toxin, RelE/StbE family [Bacteroidota bacterium]